MGLNEPLVSILMGTYNPKREHFLASLRSVVQQTYRNLEIIVINDGSEVNVRELVEEIGDDRIILIDNSINQGLTKCLNQGLTYCKGEFIARMDDDDICEPTRIQEQVEIFLSNAEVKILGCDVRVFGEANRISHYILKNSREGQQVDLFFNNVSVAHPSVMLRKSFLDQYALRYNENYVKAQDYGLWVDCVQYSKIHCLGEVLLNYRIHEGQISSKSRVAQCEAQNSIRLEQLKRLQIIPTDEEFALHIRFCEDLICDKYIELKHCGKWIRKLKTGNRKVKYFHYRTFKKELGKRFIVGWRESLKSKFDIKKIFIGFLFLDIFFDGIL